MSHDVKSKSRSLFFNASDNNNFVFFGSWGDSIQAWKNGPLIMPRNGTLIYIACDADFASWYRLSINGVTDYALSSEHLLSKGQSLSCPYAHIVKQFAVKKGDSVTGEFGRYNSNGTEMFSLFLF